MCKLKRRGFTLIEIICVIAIIGIMSSIAVPSLRGAMAAFRLDMANKTLINDLKYAKMYAVTKNVTTVYVKFLGDVDRGIYNGYVIYYPNNTVSSTLKEVNFDSNIIIDGWNSTFSNVKAENIIEFHSEGNVVPACKIVLKDICTGSTKNITLTIGYTRIMEGTN